MQHELEPRCFLFKIHELHQSPLTLQVEPSTVDRISHHMPKWKALVLAVWFEAENRFTADIVQTYDPSNLHAICKTEI